MDPNKFREECECHPVVELPAKFWKWYERNAHKYSARHPNASEEDRWKIAYADWCQD